MENEVIRGECLSFLLRFLSFLFFCLNGVESRGVYFFIQKGGENMVKLNSV